jgi:hypothetical protein
VQDTILNSGWDTFLVGAPFITLLAMVVFRLDEALMGSKRGHGPRRPGGMDANGDPILCDPDGRPSWKPRAAK